MLTYFYSIVNNLITVAQKGPHKFLFIFSDDTTRLATDAEVLAAAKAAKRLAIKTAARQIILARYPEWRQANLTARAVELVSLGETSGAEWQQMQAIWAWIKAVRARSDLLEADVANCTTVEAVDAVQLSGWPE